MRNLVILSLLPCLSLSLLPCPARPAEDHPCRLVRCREQKPARPNLNLTHSTSFVVYPADLNHMGTLFGGKLLSEMDRTAGIAARRLLYSSKAKRAVTAGIDGVKFHRPGRAGDLLLVTAKVTSLGAKAIDVKVEVWREGDPETDVKFVAEAVFTFVAWDAESGKAVEHGLELDE